MKKNINLRKIQTLAIIGLAMALASCEGDPQKIDGFSDSDQASSGKADNTNLFGQLCTLRGGDLKEDRCVCKEEVCDAEIVCHSNNGFCANKVEKTGSCETQGETYCNSGQLYTCNKNLIWSQPMNCTYGCASDHQSCAECIGNIKRCSENRIQKCQDESWILDKNCDFGCKSGTDVCKDSCLENEEMCTDGQISRCHDGSYGTPQPCENQTSCRNESQCGECTNGSTSCENGKMKTCITGMWSEAESCPGHTSCKNDAECGECEDGSTECSDGKIKRCENGVWSEEEACPEEASCKSATECGICKDGTSVCTDYETKMEIQGYEKMMNVGYVKVCLDGVYSEPVKCEGDHSCRSSSACGECLDKVAACYNDEEGAGSLRLCDKGRFALIDPCSFSTSCLGLGEEYSCGYCNNAKSAKYTCVRCFDSTIKAGLCDASKGKMYAVYQTKCVDGNLQDKSKFIDYCNDCDGNTYSDCINDIP